MLGSIFDMIQGILSQAGAGGEAQNVVGIIFDSIEKFFSIFG